ncbi:hypothetical protein HN499_01985 [archaeon]|nr:hypothetical protein [archaeon]
MNDTKGRPYFIAANSDTILLNALRGRAWKSVSARECNLADSLGLDLDSFEEVSPRDARVAERAYQFEAFEGKEILSQDGIFYLGYAMDPRQNLAFKGKGQLLKV